MSNARKSTNKLLELIEGGVLDKDEVIRTCLTYMSEWEVDDMCSDNGFLEDPEEDEEDEDDS